MSAEEQSGRPRGDQAGRGDVVHPLEWARRRGAFPEVLEVMERSLGRRRRRRAGLASAAMLLLCLGTGVGLALRQGALERAAAGTSVARTTPAHQALADGTVVEVRDGGRVRAEYSPAVRRVVLEAGQAHFQVTKDPSRPFVVVVGAVEVRAVGTAFSVERGAREIEVIVTEGRVRVAKHDPAASRATVAAAMPGEAPLADLSVGASAVVDLAKGEQAPRVQVSQLTPTQLTTRLAWRIPILEFTATPLADAIAQVNRHADITLSLGDPALREVKLSGRLRADNVETLLRLLEDEHGMRATRRGAAEIVLHRAR